MNCHHRHSSLEGREPEQKSARLDSLIGTSAMMMDDDQWREASEPSLGGTPPKLKDKERNQNNNIVTGKVGSA